MTSLNAIFGSAAPIAALTWTLFLAILICLAVWLLVRAAGRIRFFRTVLGHGGQRWHRRSGGLVAAYNAVNALVGTHDNGATYLTESILTQSYLLAKGGAGGEGYADICGAADRPIGVFTDQAETVGMEVNVDHLTGIKRTVKLTASKAIPAFAYVYTVAGGKVTDVSTGTNHLVGIALTATAGNNEYLEVLPHLPVPIAGGPASVEMTGEDDEDGTGTMTVQCIDGAGNPLAGRFLLRAWVDDTAYGAPTALTGFTASTGTTLQAVTANAHLLVITAADGSIVLELNPAANGTQHVMIEVGGRIFTASVSTTGDT